MDPQAIAHYRITSKLGERRHGRAVYRATDTKLARDVAIKVLPEAFANDPDRMARCGPRMASTSLSDPMRIPACTGIRSDGVGEPLRLTQSKTFQSPASFSPDGKRLAFEELDTSNGMDIWTLPLAGSDPENLKPGKPEPFLRTQFTEMYPAFSPDGRWIAYSSNNRAGLRCMSVRFPDRAASGRCPLVAV